MYVKLSSRELNSHPYSTHLTNIYTYKVTITPTVCNGLLTCALRTILNKSFKKNFDHFQEKFKKLSKEVN